MKFDKIKKLLSYEITKQDFIIYTGFLFRFYFYVCVIMEAWEKGLLYVSMFVFFMSAFFEFFFFHLSRVRDRLIFLEEFFKEFLAYDHRRIQILINHVDLMKGNSPEDKRKN